MLHCNVMILWLLEMVAPFRCDGARMAPIRCSRLPAPDFDGP